MMLIALETDTAQASSVIREGADTAVETETDTEDEPNHKHFLFHLYTKIMNNK